MIVIKQRQFLQEFTFAISLESGRSSLIEKKGQHKTRHVQHVPKHVNTAYLAFYKESHVDRNCLYGSFHNYVESEFTTFSIFTKARQLNGSQRQK